MKCNFPQTSKHPTTNHFNEHRCGQCSACRTTRAQEWTLRILLESFLHEHSTFVTLTYEQAPHNYSLSKYHAQAFLKRLRNLGYTFRYFLVGEYGTDKHRPHYHAILFGLPLEAEGDVEKAWGHGYIKMDEISLGRASYAAKYCLKKMTKPEDFPCGRDPEFSIMSRRPGIGFGMVSRIAKALGDRPPEGAIRIQGKTFPIDRNLRIKIAEAQKKPQNLGKALAQSLKVRYKGVQEAGIFELLLEKEEVEKVGKRKMEKQTRSFF